MITGIILAAGFSKRMGKDKLLLEIEGKIIIERVIKACVKSKLDKIILVYRKEEVRKIGKKYNIQTIYNRNAAKGQSQSVKLGVKATEDNSSYMFILGDQAFINFQTIDKLIGQYKGSKSSITIPYYGGKRGMTLIMSSRYKEELLAIWGDKGARDIIKRNFKEADIVDIEDEKIGIDIDRPEDIANIEKFMYQ